MPWYSTDNFTIDDIVRNSTLQDELIEQWATTQTGPLVDSPVDVFGFLRVNSSVLGGPDPSAGPTSSHIELVTTVSNLFVSALGSLILIKNGFPPFREASPDTGAFFSIVTNVVSPASRTFLALQTIPTHTG